LGDFAVITVPAVPLSAVMAAPGHFVPGVSRPPTSFFELSPKQDVGARHKAGHDSECAERARPYFFAGQYFWKYFGSGGGWFFWIGIT
jgi:hypothetical protein